MNKELKVGLLVLAAIAVFGWLAVQIGAVGGFGKTITVDVAFADAAGLVQDSAVKVAGVQVGRVRGLRVEFDRAVATLVLQAEAELRRDVRAEVRARSLLGEKYVALVPVSDSAPLLRDGESIDHAVEPVEIDAVVQAIGPLLEKVDPDDVARIVSNLADVLAATGQELPSLTASLKEASGGLGDALDLIGELQQDVPKLVAELRGATRELRAVLGKVDQRLDEAQPVIADLGQAAKQAPSAVQDARQLVADARGAIDDVEPGLDDLRDALQKSDELLARLDKLVAGFEGFDEGDLRRLLRDEGVLIRLKPRKGDPPFPGE